MTDQELMQFIKAKWGPEIMATVDASGVPVPPAAFLAGLIANESGGNENAKRFEPAVFTTLSEVLLGRKENYGSLRAADLLAFVIPADGFGVDTSQQWQRAFFSGALNRLASLATSWGLTQIMGYQILAKDLVPIPAVDTQSLASVGMSLHYTVGMLRQFAREFHLDVTKDFSALLHCWNGGHPDAQTFDPAYVPNALHRMDLYKALP